MRGFRVNRTAKTGLSFEVARKLAERVKDFGWHVQFLLDIEDHPDLDSFLGNFPTEVVIDHMGRPDPKKGVNAPGFQALIRLLQVRPRLGQNVGALSHLAARAAV